MMKKRGITITESLVTIILLTIIVMATIGGFVISKMDVVRANHRTVAMSLIREYMEKEIANGYNFGQYYTLAEAGIDRSIDGTVYSIVPEPCVAGSNPLLGVDATESGRHYKIIGFRVQWNEPVYGGVGYGGVNYVQCSERAVTYIAQR